MGKKWEKIRKWSWRSKPSEQASSEVSKEESLPIVTQPPQEKKEDSPTLGDTQPPLKEEKKEDIPEAAVEENPIQKAHFEELSRYWNEGSSVQAKQELTERQASALKLQKAHFDELYTHWDESHDKYEKAKKESNQ